MIAPNGRDLPVDNFVTPPCDEFSHAKNTGREAGGPAAGIVHSHYAGLAPAIGTAAATTATAAIATTAAATGA
jgi:hypothetical protein